MKIPKISSIQCTKSNCKLTSGRHKVRLDRLDWSEAKETLYAKVSRNGSLVSPAPACQLTQGDFQQQHIERYLSLLDALGLTEDQFRDLADDGDLNSLAGVYVDLLVEVLPATLTKKEAILYKFAPHIGKR